MQRLRVDTSGDHPARLRAIAHGKRSLFLYGITYDVAHPTMDHKVDLSPRVRILPRHDYTAPTGF